MKKFAHAHTEKFFTKNNPKILTLIVSQLHVVAHEIGHVVGFFHEQSRNDRDDAIIINWENVEDGYELQFKKEEDVNFGYQYDYSSVMQYPSWVSV